MLPHPAPPEDEKTERRGRRHAAEDAREAKKWFPHRPSRLDENEGGACPFQSADHQTELKYRSGP